MPTARPIIIEKFIDHTDSGVTPVPRCSSAKPTAMPATASRRGRPAAIAEPKATNRRMTVGSPESSSALCRACSLSSLKSCHTAHSPVASASAPAGRSMPSTVAISSPADSGRSASVRAARLTGTSAASPSGLSSPASAGWARGSITAVVPGVPCRPATRFSEAGRVVGDGRVLPVGDDRRLGTELREVASQLVADLLGGGSLCLPAGARQRRGERHAPAERRRG